jgi:hypothetical protein
MAFVYPSNLTINVSRSFGDAAAEQDYRLVALPGKSGSDIGATLQGEAGANWQAVWDTGAEQDYFREYDGSDTFRFAPGRGFWVISDSEWSVDATFETVDLIADTAATIPLHEGWNIISNPLDKNVPWSEVNAANGGGLQALWAFGGSFSEATTFASAKGGEAFYFLNNQGLDELMIPYPGAPSKTMPSQDAAGQPLKQYVATAGSPEVTHPTFSLTARQDGRAVSRVQVGLHSEAKAGLDAYDQFAPPGQFEAASLRLIAPNEGATKRLQYLAREFRPTQEEGARYELTLRTAPGEPVTLETDGLDGLEGQEVVLIDQSTARPYDLREQMSVTLSPSKEELGQNGALMLHLLVGSSTYVAAEQAEVIPDRLELYPNYPNPFRGQTTLEYALPEDGAVSLVIYDILGRRVQTLVGREQRAGFHRVQWDGRNAQGQPVASGVYLVRLSAQGAQHLQKMVIVR